MLKEKPTPPRRRWAGFFYNTNTSQIQVYGNHYFANPATNSAQWQNFGSGVYQNIDKVIHPAGYINSYNATAWCIGHDGGTHFVSTSETN